MTIEVTAKKLDDAIKQGLEQLGATLDEVDVKVLESGGLFRKAKVRLTLEREEDKAAEKTAKPAAGPEKADAAAKPEQAVKTEETAKPEAAPSAEHVENKAEAQEKKPAVKKSADKPKKTESAADESGARTEKPAKKHAKAADAKPEPDKADAAGDVKTDNEEGAVQSDGAEKPAKKRKLRGEEKEAAEHAAEFIKNTVALMGFGETEVTVDFESGKIDIAAPEHDDSLIIGRHGETLSALTYLAETCARAEKCHLNIIVDCNGYRERREKSLASMARRRARECASKHRRIKLEPMDRTDRRTVHMALSDDAYVTTSSEGKEPYRCVVISPKDGVIKEDRAERSHDRRSDKPRSGSSDRPRAVFDARIHGPVPRENTTAAENETSEQASGSEE